MRGTSKILRWLNKIYHEKNMFLRHFRRFERCSCHLIESVTTYSESQFCLRVRRQGVVLRDNEHHPANLRMSRKQIVYTFLWCFQTCFFNYTTTARLHSLAANSTCKVMVSFSDTCVLKALTKGLENIKIVHPDSTHEHWVGFKLWTTSINNLGTKAHTQNMAKWPRVKLKKKELCG